MQSELSPSHQLLLEHPGEGVFQEEGEELSSPPKEERPTCTDHERQSKRKQVSRPLPAAWCGVPAAQWQGKTERKVITGTGKPGAEPNTQNHSKQDRKRYAPLQQVFALKQQQHQEGSPNPLPTHPTTAKSPGLTITLVITLSANQRTTKSPRVRCSLPWQSLQGLSVLAQQYFIPETVWDSHPQNTHSTWRSPRSLS